MKCYTGRHNQTSRSPDDHWADARTRSSMNKDSLPHLTAQLLFQHRWNDQRFYTAKSPQFLTPTFKTALAKY